MKWKLIKKPGEEVNYWLRGPLTLVLLVGLYRFVDYLCTLQAPLDIEQSSYEYFLRIFRSVGSFLIAFIGLAVFRGTADPKREKPVIENIGRIEVVDFCPESTPEQLQISENIRNYKEQQRIKKANKRWWEFWL